MFAKHIPSKPLIAHSTTTRASGSREHFKLNDVIPMTIMSFISFNTPLQSRRFYKLREKNVLQKSHQGLPDLL